MYLRLLPKLSAVAILAASMASAASLKLTTTSYSNGGNLGGGVFKAENSGLDLSNYASSALYGSGFGTFCMEYSEPFTSGSTFDYTLANYAELGGFGGHTAGKDPISMGTAWLYYQFATGALSGYNYTSKSAALELQLAFWYLETETGHSALSNYATANSYNFASNVYVTQASSQLGASLLVDANGAFGVQVLNLTEKNKPSAYKQSQLYFGGYTPPSVPDAGSTAGLALLALTGLAALRRQQR